MNKICLIIHSLGIGGMERVMAQLASRFSEKEMTEVHLVLIGKSREMLYPVPDRVIIHKPGFPFSNSRRTFHTLKTMQFLRRTVKSIEPDTILSFGEMWNNLVLLSLYGLGYPVYVADRSQPDKDLGMIHNFLRDRFYPGAAGYIAQTKKAAEICSQNGWNRNITVIGNPIRKMMPGTEKEKENMVLFVGRLIPTKHVDQLIEMFKEINMPGWKLCIVGGDAKRMNISEELKQLAKKLRAEHIIMLEDRQEDVDSYYRKSKIFAFTSSSEGFPNVVGEALSAKLPVVAYNCTAGPADMIENGINGYLIPLFDRNEFKQKLKLLMEDESLRQLMGENGCEMIGKFDTEQISERFFRTITNSESVQRDVVADVK